MHSLFFYSSGKDNACYNCLKFCAYLSQIQLPGRYLHNYNFPMLTPKEEEFILYWQQNRDREKKLFRQLLIGLPSGMLLAIGIVASVVTGQWYQRADMVANSELNPNVLIIAVLAIVVFVAIFYKKFQWDQKEQLYKELLSKKQKQESSLNTDATE